jgi:hypothetical protein
VAAVGSRNLEINQNHNDKPVILPHELEIIIIDYLGNEGKNKYQHSRQLMLFENVSALLLSQTAHHLLSANPDPSQEEIVSLLLSRSRFDPGSTAGAGRQDDDYR